MVNNMQHTFNPKKGTYTTIDFTLRNLNFTHIINLS